MNGTHLHSQRYDLPVQPDSPTDCGCGTSRPSTARSRAIVAPSHSLTQDSQSAAPQPSWVVATARSTLHTVDVT